MRIFSFLLGFIFLSNTLFAQNDTLCLSPFSNRMLSFSEISYSDQSLTADPVFGIANALNVSPDVTPRKSLFNSSCSKFIIPALCVAYGVTARFNETPLHQFDKYVAERVDVNIHRHYPIDNYLQVTPAILAYGLDFIPGIKSRHNFRDRTFILATSYLFMGAVVKTMKNEIPVVRPRGWEDDAFPSGHTAVAFTGAHVLYKEYKDQSPWIGVGGYTVAAATGVFRVLNRAHWVSDIVTGAGIGILSAEVGYMMLPVWHRIFGISEDAESIVIMPSVSTQSYGLGLVYVF